MDTVGRLRLFLSHQNSSRKMLCSNVLDECGVKVKRFVNLIVPIALASWRLAPWNEFAKRISIVVAAGRSSFHRFGVTKMIQLAGGETEFQNVEIVSCNRLQGDRQLEPAWRNDFHNSIDEYF